MWLIIPINKDLTGLKLHVAKKEINNSSESQYRSGTGSGADSSIGSVAGSGAGSGK